MTLRRILTVAIGVPVVLLVLYLLVFGAFFTVGPAAENYSQRVAFDAPSWRARSLDQDVKWPTRLRMIDDLMGKRRLDGLSPPDVLALLGPADQTSKWKEWDLVYWLGPERGPFGVDSEWLVIKFDSSGAVQNYQIVRD